MSPGFRALLHRALVWVLVGLIPTQGTVAGVFATLGPAHVHRQALAAPIELEDFRRSPARVAPRIVHVGIGFGHFHRSVEPARHHHSRSDSTIVRDPGDAAPQMSDADESNAGPALFVLTALVPSVPSWLPPASTDVVAASDAWPSLTHDREPPERPPRRG